MNNRNTADDCDLPDSLRDELMQALAPVELAVELRQRMRDKIIASTHDVAPEGTTTQRAGAWVQIAPSVEMLELRRDATRRIHTSLMRMQPGGCVPAHRHTQEEEFLVIEGECHIGTHRLCAGDMHVAAAGSFHGAVTTQTGVLVLIRGEFPYPTGDIAVSTKG